MIKKFVAWLFLALLALVPAGAIAQTTQTYYTVPSLSALTALTGRPAVVTVAGGSSSNNLVSGTYLWFANDVTAANGTTIIQPSTGPAGRYKSLAYNVQTGLTPLYGGIANGVSYRDSSGVLQTTGAANNAVLVTGGSGVPAISTTLPAVAASAATVTSSGSTTARALSGRFAEVKNVLDYGATGDGSTDDGVAIAAAITAVASGGAVSLPVPSTCYKITSAISITKSLTLTGQASKICQVTANTVGISVTASNVAIDGIYLEGPATATYQGAAQAIGISGTFNAGLAPTYISNVVVRNTRITKWGAYGIYAAYVDQLLIANNYMNDVGYAGVGIISSKNGRVEGNTIDTVGPGTSSNAYGIFLSRASGDAGELTSQPRTTDFAVVGNTIRNVPVWECLDTHAGERISFTANTTYNCYYGIVIGSSPNSAAANTYAPLQVAVAGNVIDSGVTNGTAGNGIVFQGVLSGAKATGTITGNVVKYYGTQSNTDGSSGVYAYATSGLSVTGNTIINPSPRGVSIYQENTGFIVSGNTIVDAWSDSGAVGYAYGIQIRVTNNTGLIGDNTCTTNGLSATYLLSTGTGACIVVADNTGNAVQLGVNYSVATTYLIDSGSRASTLLKNVDLTSIVSLTSILTSFDVIKNQNAATEVALRNSDVASAASRGFFRVYGGSVSALFGTINTLGVFIGSDSNHYIRFQQNGGTKAWLSTNGAFTVGTTEQSLTGAGALWAGAATLSSVNKVAVTAPATGATLTIPDGLTLNAGPGGTLTSTAFTALGTSGAAVPLLSTANTWTLGQTFSAGAVIASGQPFQLGNAYVNSLSVSTGYVLITDSTGTVYEIAAKLH